MIMLYLELEINIVTLLNHYSIFFCITVNYFKIKFTCVLHKLNIECFNQVLHFGVELVECFPDKSNMLLYTFINFATLEK